MAPYGIGIDTGGTFTDVVLLDLATGRDWRLKVPTTPDDAARGILAGVRQALTAAGAHAADLKAVAHGTTLATNAVLEGKWARTGLVTTAGFADILDLARQRRPSFFNLDVPKPTPPAAPEDRVAVPERIGPGGEVVRPIDEAVVREGALRLKAAGCKAVAVCFLHAYANPAHERRAAEIVREVWPEAYVTQSSDLLAEYREFERFATAAVNASLMPLLDRYLARFEDELRGMGVAARPQVMQSNGGSASPDAIRQAPVNTFFSGPAGGVIGAAALGRAAGLPDLITFDMGGTSTDVCLIRGGAPSRSNVREMGGFPVRAPTLDLHTIGAGGGSIAWVDAGGMLHVGPKSAGAQPGPAAYRRGGTAATVTDANMVLGRLNPVALLDGAMAVDADLARAAVERDVAAPLGLEAPAAAAGVLDIVNVNMMGAVRVISVERGEDPRRFLLMPFGGAGPLHAADVAAMMQMPRVVVPPAPGVLSALGLLQADARGDFSQTRLLPAAAEAVDDLNDALRALDGRADAWLAQEGLRPDAATFARSADMRYRGQSYELPIDLATPAFDPASLAAAVEAFHARHRAAYGHAMPDRPVEIVFLRLAVEAANAAPTPAPPPVLTGDPVRARRDVWFRETGFLRAPVFDRRRIGPGFVHDGPAIVEQMDATTVVPPNARLSADAFGNLLIDLEVPA